MSGAGVIGVDEEAETHPESSSAIKTKLATIAFIFVVSMTTILTACSGPQICTFDLIGDPNPFAVLGFADKYGLTSTFLMDRSGAVGFKYRLGLTPTTYFLDPSGVVQDIRVGAVSYSWLEKNVERSLQ